MASSVYYSIKNGSCSPQEASTKIGIIKYHIERMVLTSIREGIGGYQQYNRNIFCNRSFVNEAERSYSKFGNKKSRNRPSLRNESGIVLRTIQISKHVIEYLEVLNALNY